MFRKLNKAFGAGRGGDYHSAATVRLVRSASMLVVGGDKGPQDATLRRSRSSVSVSVESRLYYHSQEDRVRLEDRVWLYSQNQNCLEYLEALVALRREYTRSLARLHTNSSPSSKKKAPPPPAGGKGASDGRLARGVPPAAPPAAPSEEDSLMFLDQVLASCDPEAQRKPYQDHGHADVDFIVASSSADHDLHSNWVLRVPRVPDTSQQKTSGFRANRGSVKEKTGGGSTSSRLQLRRNPLHLPKVVESALKTLRFKPRTKKQ